MTILIFMLLAILFAVMAFDTIRIKKIRAAASEYAMGNLEIEESYQQIIISADEKITALKTEIEILESEKAKLAQDKVDLLDRSADLEMRLAITQDMNRMIVEEFPRSPLVLPDIGKPGLF